MTVDQILLALTRAVQENAIPLRADHALQLAEAVHADLERRVKPDLNLDRDTSGDGV